MSSLKQADALRLLETIDSLHEGGDIYLFGMTNVGKSSIVNQISRVLNIPSDITVSNMVGTTLDFIKLPLPNKTFLIDTPGILNTGQVTYYLDKRNLSLLTPKKFIRPTVFQLNEKQALFLGGFCILRFTEGERSSFVAYMPSMLVCHRTKLENADSFYQDHKDDILKIPNEEERKKLGNFVSYEFSFDKSKKIDITISGLGFVTLSGSGKVRVDCFETIRVGVREAIV
jgi:ribosome biogenesis GTPase A